MIDYKKMDYQYQQHHERFRRRVEAGQLLCQECGGSGQYVAEYFDYCARYEDCGFCEGTGKVTPWLRGLWLRFKRQGRKGKGGRKGWVTQIRRWLKRALV